MYRDYLEAVSWTEETDEGLVNDNPKQALIGAIGRGAMAYIRATNPDFYEAMVEVKELHEWYDEPDLQSHVAAEGY